MASSGPRRAWQPTDERAKSAYYKSLALRGRAEAANDPRPRGPRKRFEFSLPWQDTRTTAATTQNSRHAHKFGHMRKGAVLGWLWQDGDE